MSYDLVFDSIPSQLKLKYSIYLYKSNKDLYKNAIIETLQTGDHNMLIFLDTRDYFYLKEIFL